MDFFQKEFKIYIFKDKINIVNYSKINLITEKEIKIDSITIIGDDLTVIKMVDNEILIKGIIKELKLL
jgi:hypothetical protein